MFQNLPTKIFGNESVIENTINIELKIIIQSLNKSQLDEFWIVRTLKFVIYIERGKIDIIINNEMEINVILLHIT